MTEIPKPELTDEEVKMLEAIRRMGHTEAWRRILNHQRPESGTYIPGTTKDVNINLTKKSSEDSKTDHKKRPVR